MALAIPAAGTAPDAIVLVANDGFGGFPRLGNRLEGERVVDESVGADALECIGRSRVGDAVERNVAHCHPFRNGNHFHYDATVRKIATESNRYKRVHT
mgnify:CR=1 FL=1